MRSALPAVAAALLLVLAGCSGVGPSPDPTPEPTPETTTQPQYPPGVQAEAEALVNPDALLRAHRESVREHGAVTDVAMNMTGHPDDQTVSVVVEESWRAAPGLSQITHTWQQTRVTANGSWDEGYVELYANETVVVTRQVEDENVTMSSQERGDTYDDLLLAQATASPLLERAFEQGRFAVTGTERRNGRTVTTLRAAEEELTDEGRSLFVATLEVTAAGRVLSVSVTRDRNANQPGGRRTVELTVSKGTGVQRPEWLDNRTASQ